jgi:flagellar hook-associated protein 1 FlgK
MSILNILNIGTTALVTAQKAMATTANNIANASTPGYTRQQVDLSSIPAGMNTAIGQSGRGVTITDIRRMYDAFTTLQLRTEKSNSSYWDTYSGVSSSIESIFNETSNTGIASAISTFFNDWQSVAQNPQDSVQRTQLINDANYLGSRIGSAYNILNDQRTQLYKNSQVLVTQVNNITKQIADLNNKIAQSPGSLDLLDQRDLQVEQLNQIASVNTVQDSSGRYNIFLGGAVLVSSSGSYDMSVALDSNNNMQFSINTTGTATNINNQLAGGQLRANLDMRDTVIPGYMNSLNAFAIDLSDKVNSIHRQGFGLDGSTGNDFFNNLANITNPAVGTMSSVSVSDVSAYGATINDQYRIDYSNASTGSNQQEGASGIYWGIQQSSDGGTTWAAVPTSSVTLTADSAAIPAYRTLSFNGLTMKIDGTQAAISTAGSGTFDVQLNRNAATSLKSSITDVRQVAAAQTAANLPGDNTNAQAIAGLVNQNFIANIDPVKFYGDMVSTAGADAQSANTYVNFETAMVNQLESQRQSASGVSLDEEAVNLVQFQKTYEAAAKMISVGSDLLDTLMGIIR